MPKILPARPNLEHLKTQAKSLLAAFRSGNAEAANSFIRYIPEAAGLTPLEVLQQEYRLADAQAVIARKTGFGAWPSLARHVDRLRSMEGTWAFRSLEVEGSTIPAAQLQNSRFLIDGDRFRMESPEGNFEGIFTIDVDHTPHQIDIDFIEGPHAGSRCEGLFEIELDNLRFCLGLVGSKRPECFETKPGTGHALEELVRIQHARPSGVDGGTLSPPMEQQHPLTDITGFDNLPTETLEKLQGEWRLIELINSGTVLPSAYSSLVLRTQNGNVALVKMGSQTFLHAKARFVETMTPLHVDYLQLEGPAKGLLSLGLFRWHEEEAVFCIGAVGQDRPTDFGCEKDSGRTFSRWRRGK